MSGEKGDKEIFIRSSKTPRSPVAQSQPSTVEPSETSESVDTISDLPGGKKRIRQQQSGTPSPEQIDKRQKEMSFDSFGNPLTPRRTGALVREESVKSWEDVVQYLKGMELRMTSATKDKILDHDIRLEAIEVGIRVKNVIIHGIEETKKNVSDRDGNEETFAILLKKMGLNDKMDYDDIYRLGKWKAGIIRPLMVKFVRMRDKKEFLSARKQLKGTTIRITEDETKLQRGRNKVFADAYRQHWNIDNKIRRRIRGNKMVLFKEGNVIDELIVDGQGKIYTTKQ